jgi:hypothetical protein
MGDPLVPPFAPSLRAATLVPAGAEPAKRGIVPALPLVLLASRRAEPGFGGGWLELKER